MLRIGWTMGWARNVMEVSLLVKTNQDNKHISNLQHTQLGGIVAPHH